MSGCKKEACSNVSICKRSKQIEGEGVDRISSLHDNLLVSILSLLPIEYAAATSVLSRRWRHLWTHITHISFVRHKRIYCHANVIAHIFSQLNSPKIHYFHLSWNISPPTKAYKQDGASVIVRWILDICVRNPEVIEVDFPFFGVGCVPEVPSTVFETQSLVDLRFTGMFKVPDHTKLLIDLPNLKTLNLSVGDSNYSLIGMLFKCCPLLEDLSLSMCALKEQEAYFVHITAPNLKRLLIDMQDYSSYSLNNHKFVVDAPMLEYCDMTGDLVFYDFVRSPSNLLEVIIWLPSLGNIDNCRTKILQLFQGFAGSSPLS